jgi:hypothetical protein
MGILQPVPRITKALLSRQLSVHPEAQMGAGSCTFDFTARLGLLQGQPNAHLAEFETFPMDRIIHQRDHYCGWISRHGLVLLISKHLQRIEHHDQSSTAICTDIGCFKISEHNDVTFLHFNVSTRESLTSSCRRSSASPSEWQVLLGKLWLHQLSLVCSHKHTLLSPLIYMPDETVQRWQVMVMVEFSMAMMVAMLAVNDSVREPVIVARALARYRLTPRPALPTCVEEYLSSSARLPRIVPRGEMYHHWTFNGE